MCMDCACDSKCMQAIDRTDTVRSHIIPTDTYVPSHQLQRLRRSILRRILEQPHRAQVAVQHAVHGNRRDMVVAFTESRTCHLQTCTHG